MSELQTYTSYLNCIIQTFQQSIIKYFKDLIRRRNGIKFLIIVSLIMFALFNLIFSSIWTFHIYGIDNSTLFNNYQDILKQQYVIDIYTNSSCNLGDKEVRYEVPPTIDGCKCQEQLYTQNCTQRQKDSQKCTQINSTNSITLNLWPFQLEKNFSYAQKICIVKSKTSLYEQIIQNNKCTKEQELCGDENNHICVMKDEKCPISHFRINQQIVITKQRRQQAIIRIDNIQRNNTEPLIGINVTNGKCGTLQNSSNYTLNKQQESECQFQQLMVPIIEYPAAQILKVNQKYLDYRNARKLDDLNNQSYLINGLRQYYAAPQCRYKYRILDPFEDLKRTEITILCTVIVFIIFQIINLFIMFSYIRQQEQQHRIEDKSLNIFYICYLISILILLVMFIVYQIQINNNCWKLELESDNLVFPIINIIFTLIQAGLFFKKVYKIHYQSAKVFPDKASCDNSNSIFQDKSQLQSQNRTSLSMALNNIQVGRFQSIEELNSAVTKTEIDFNSPIRSKDNQEQQLKKPKQNKRKIYRQVSPLDNEQNEQQENQFNRIRKLSN